MAVIRPWRRSGVALAVLLLVLDAASAAEVAQRPDEGWQPALLELWLDAVERHVPGKMDGFIGAAATWSPDDLRKLWNDTQVLLEIAASPKRTRFRIPPPAGLVPSRPPVAAEFKFNREERQILDAFAERVRVLGLNVVRRRAVIVHTDAMTLAPDLAAADTGAAWSGAPLRLMIGDGTSLGSGTTSLHWELARMLLDGIRPDPRADPFVLQWYRATLALAQSTEFFDSVHLGHARRLFPDDPDVLLLAGCEREAFASPLFQAFARSTRSTMLRAGIKSIEDELDEAARYYRRAIQGRPAFAEAHVRLGRVLTLQGRYADGLAELDRAVGLPLEPVMEYFAALYRASAHEGLGDAARARADFERAATMMPGARAPHLALARLAREQGDRGEMTARLDRALAAPVDATDLDPFLRYHSVQGRHAPVWLDEARDASRRTAP